MYCNTMLRSSMYYVTQHYATVELGWGQVRRQNLAAEGGGGAEVNVLILTRSE